MKIDNLSSIANITRDLQPPDDVPRPGRVVVPSMANNANGSTGMDIDPGTQGRSMTPELRPSCCQNVSRWGVILAGGDGMRLRPLTRYVFGDDRPKQFCPLLGRHTLFQETRKRAERSICAGRILYSLTQTHREYYYHDLSNRRDQAVVQPCNKGTAPAIISALLHIHRLDRNAVVAILPSDHYYSREDVFTAALEQAFAVAEMRPDSIVLLGAPPKAAEVEYGWLDLGDSVRAHPDVFRVNAFLEKPALWMAERLLLRGSLWNTFVMVGRISAFLDAGRESVPDLVQALAAWISPKVEGETQIPGWLYDRIATVDFSKQVLSPVVRRLVTLRLAEVDWNDLGDPGRVLATLSESTGNLPDWAARWRCLNSADRCAAQSALFATG